MLKTDKISKGRQCRVEINIVQRYESTLIKIMMTLIKKIEKLTLKDTEPEGMTKCSENSVCRTNQEASMVLTKHHIETIVMKPFDVGIKLQPVMIIVEGQHKLPGKVNENCICVGILAFTYSLQTPTTGESRDYSQGNSLESFRIKQNEAKPISCPVSTVT